MRTYCHTLLDFAFINGNWSCRGKLGSNSRLRVSDARNDIDTPDP